MTCRERIESYLRQHQVAFEIHPHRAAFTAQGVAEREHIPGQRMVKVVIVVADGAMVMLALPTSRRVDLADVRALLAAREVWLAGEGDLAAAFPDCEVGAMPPFGNLYCLPTYVDSALADEPTIFFQAGSHAEAISMAYADFVRLTAPTVASFTHAHGRPHPPEAGERHQVGGW